MSSAVRQAVDVALDGRLTTHMSAGMALYVRKLIEWLPRIAPDLRFAFVGTGDNFDLREQVGLPLALARSRARLAHLPSPFVPALVPVPFVVTIHDLIDLHYPQFGKRKVGPYYRYGVGPVVRRARAVITDDEATAADLQAFLDVDPARIRIIPLGVDLPTRIPAVSLPANPYFLYVGNRRGHKNLETLVQAWATLAEARPVDLVLTGEADRAPVLAASERLRGRLRFTGPLGDAELVAWYRSASAYVHPALREGFGLPMLEAMRAGVPVIAARSALPRVLAPYAFAFEALDIAALGALLARALDEPQFATLASAAQAATAKFTWERTIRQTVAVYREFLP